MAKNRMPVPVESESSENDDSSSYSSDEEAPIPEPQKPIPPVSSSDDEESDSEPDLQPPPAKNSAPAKPITPAKRIAQETEEELLSKNQQKSKNKKKKTNQEDSPPPPEEPKEYTTTTSKKTSDSVDSSLALALATAPDGTKKLFQRVWTDEDEVTILQGMIDYQADKAADPRADCEAFLEFIKDKLDCVDANKNQLQDKIRRLKSKYDNIRNKNRGQLLKKPHDVTVYDLSDKIWGHESTNKANGNGNKKTAPVDVEKVLGSGSVSGLSMEDKILLLGDDLFGGESSNADEARKWNRLRKEEMEICLKKLDIKRAQIRLVLDNYK